LSEKKGFFLGNLLENSVLTERKNVMITLGQLSLLNKLNGFIAAGTNGHIGLFSNSISSITPDTQLSDLVEANFSGYSRGGNITWPAPFIDPISGIYQVSSPEQQFIADANMTPQTIHGYFLLNSTGTYLGAEKFALPVNLVEPNQGLSFTVIVSA
jgi:hypothetical protein